MAINHSKQKQIAARYAKAGFALASEAQKAAAVSEALQALKAAYHESAELRRVVKSPMVKAPELKAAFDAILASLKADAVAGQMLHQLIDNGRADLLPAVADAFEAKCDEAQGIVRVEVISSKKLTAKETKDITAALGGDKVALSNKVDPAIIGGIQLRMGSKMLDASVAGRLSRLAQTLTQTGIENA